MTHIYKSILVAAFVAASLLLATAPTTAQIGGDGTGGFVFIGAPCTDFDTAYTQFSTDCIQGETSQLFGYNITSWTYCDPPSDRTRGLTWEKELDSTWATPDTVIFWTRIVSRVPATVSPRIGFDFLHGDTVGSIGWVLGSSMNWVKHSGSHGTLSNVALFNKFRVRHYFVVTIDSLGSVEVLVDRLEFGYSWGRVVFNNFEAPPPPETYLTVSPETLMVKGLNGKFLKPVKRGKGLKPNWANLLEETVVQGGFQPLASESDQAGGMVIGTSHMYEAAPNKWKPIKDSANVRAWVRLSKWNWRKSAGTGYAALQKTLENKVFTHNGPARGLDSTGLPGDLKRKPLKKQLTMLDPKKHSNQLFAELVAFKLNIAASQLGKTPVGFGELVYDMDGSFLDEMEVDGIAAKADSMMTYWQGVPQVQFDSLYAALHRINRAFVRQLDTISFTPPPGLQLVGVALDTTPGFFLKKQSPPVAPRRLMATTMQMEDEEKFEDEEWEELMDGQPYASRLYQNYPNPFNPTTSISFRVSEPSVVTLQVYDVLGRHIATLLRGEEMDEGYETVEFAASGFASGVYFYRLESVGMESGEASVITRKMVVMK